MAVFRNEPEEWQRLDWAILRNGWVSLYARPEFLIMDISWFRKERYRVMELDCSRWADAKAMHADLKLKFRFPENYGHTFKALQESLAEVTVMGAGLVTVLHHFDRIEQELAQRLLQAFAENARFHMLLGERIITLAQLDDPEVRYQPVGAMPVVWNPHEWHSSPE